MAFFSNFITKAESTITPRHFRLLSWIGLFGLTFKTAQFLYGLRQFFYFQNNLIARYGGKSWAFITGGANGIGGAFARELAKQGFSICVVDKDEEGLHKLEQDLKAINSKVEFRKISADLAHIANEGYIENITNQVQDIDISILINNVGCGESGDFHKSDEKRVREIAIVNMLTPVLITRKLISKLLSRKAQKSAIINLSSLVAERPTIFWNIYGGTKKFVEAFSDALAEEYCGRLDVLTVRPGTVSTPMTHFIQGPEVVNADDFVKDTLKKLGKTSKTAGHWKHQLEEQFARSRFLQLFFHNRATERAQEVKGQKPHQNYLSGMSRLLRTF